MRDRTRNEALNGLLTNDVTKLAVGQAQYTLLCNQRGGVVDDVIVYRLEPSVYLVIVNASNIEKDFEWMNTEATEVVVIEDYSNRYAALALQGPAANKFFDFSATLPHFHIQQHQVFGKECWVARTGYTGEDGFEIFCDATDAPHLWRSLLVAGEPLGIQPCGLGARDTLRLEMCYPLHGNDITEETTPLEAGLGKFVAFDKGPFIGSETLAEQKAKGVSRKLMAFTMADKSPPPRPHYAMLAEGRKVGEITSGTQSPTLGIGIGMGYVETASAVVGAPLEIEVRGKKFPAAICKKPILKKGA